ncbi:hypothetical protein ACWELO_32335 [Streptomyces sp. NPDC004596]|uniref:hypothetical protein n=1 Tax=Streptomyces sp. DSM 118148 TaxID=3448667 RepID=UPI0040401B63
MTSKPATGPLANSTSDPDADTGTVSTPPAEPPLYDENGNYTAGPHKVRIPRALGRSDHR